MRRWIALTLCMGLVAVALWPLLAAASEKPRIAVLRFQNKADNQWWYHGGAAAAQDVFVTELVKSGKFRVIEREHLDALMREKNLSLSGDIDPRTAIEVGRLLGVNYLLTGAVTEYGASEVRGHAYGVGRLPGVSGAKKTFVAAMNARLIETETGEIVWADEARGEAKAGRLHVAGIGGGKDDQAMFDKVLKPVVQQLVASLKVADL